MNSIIGLIATCFGNLCLLGQETVGIDKKIDDLFGRATNWFVQLVFYQIPVSDEVNVFWVLIPLVVGASWFTVYFGFPGIRLFGTAIRVVAGKYDKIGGDGDMSPEDGSRTTCKAGEVSHFQALTAALSATVGLGNIAGVAVAVSVGGAGATFWMILCGLLGMASKFVECTLGVKYREIDESGVVYGGPMYYLSKGLAAKGPGLEGVGKILAVVFAVMCIGGSFGGGNMFQANQAFKMLQNVTGDQQSVLVGMGWLFGLVMAGMVAVVIIGGIKRIATVTEKVVPLMAGIYVVAALVVIALNISSLPDAITQIIEGAFAPTAVAGGVIGVIVQGFKRAAFSNEAGIGSAAIAHSAVKTNQPASEGIVALLEPFIDTVVICTMTALVIVITGNLDAEADGVQLTSNAFASAISWFPWVLAVAVFLFAFSTMISWSYYGLQAWTYLFGRSTVVTLSYKVIFCVCVVIGAAADLGSVINFSDAMIFAMMVPNMIGLFLLAPVVKQELTKYLEAIKEN